MQNSSCLSHAQEAVLLIDAYVSPNRLHFRYRNLPMFRQRLNVLCAICVRANGSPDRCRLKRIAEKLSSRGNVTAGYFVPPPGSVSIWTKAR
jgi:hypothetical protein